MSARHVAPAAVVALVVLALASTARNAGAQTHAPRSAVVSKEPPVIYMEVEGTPPVTFHGDGLTAKNAKPTDILVHTIDFELSLTIDPRTGTLVGGRTAYKPLVITHDVGASTTQFLTAAARSENLKKVTLTFWKAGVRDKNGMGGGEAKEYVILLEDARVSTVRQFTEESRLLEEVAFTYRKITTTYVNGGYTFTDNGLAAGSQ
jgi:type VI secretion system Hcp family effector